LGARGRDGGNKLNGIETDQNGPVFVVDTEDKINKRLDYICH